MRKARGMDIRSVCVAPSPSGGGTARTRRNHRLSSGTPDGVRRRSARSSRAAFGRGISGRLFEPNFVSRRVAEEVGHGLGGTVGSGLTEGEQVAGFQLWQLDFAEAVEAGT